MTFSDFITILIIVPLTYLVSAYTKAFLAEHGNKIYRYIYRDYYRDLTETEVSFIQLHTRELVKLYRQQSYNYVFYVSFIILILLLITITFLPLGLEEKFADKLKALNQPPNKDWGHQWTEMFTRSYAQVFAVLLGANLAWVFYTIVGQFWPKLMSYLIDKLTNFETSTVTLRDFIHGRITHLVRRKTIQTDVRYEPELTRKIVFNRLNIRKGSLLTLTSFLTFTFLYFDSHSFTRISETGIKYRPYFSFKILEYDFSEIKTINRACHIRHHKGRIITDFKYEIVFTDNQAVTILNGKDSTEQLKAALRVHEYSNDHPPAVHTATKQSKRKAGFEACIDELAARGSITDLGRLDKLLSE